MSADKGGPEKTESGEESNAWVDRIEPGDLDSDSLADAWTYAEEAARLEEAALAEEAQYRAWILAMTTLSDRYERALTYAIHVHAAQLRKGTAIPYIAHLLHVSALVIEDGGDENEAIAGLLHDAVEDQGGAPRLKDIRARFGDNVADIVQSCSDTDSVIKPPWRPRKEAYVQHLRDASTSVIRVSLADKLHNAGSILQDYRREGDLLFERFNAGKADQLWYYEALLNQFRVRSVSPMVAELERVVSELGALLRS